MKVVWKGAAVNARVNKLSRQSLRNISNQIKAVCETIEDEVLRRTPVYTGETVANFQWTQGSPFTGNIAPSQTETPGITSQMSLGDEPRRSANEARSRASLRRIKFNDLTSPIFLRNNTPYFQELEFGQLPTPGHSRTPPGGILRGAMAVVRAKFGNLSWLKITD